MNTREVGARLVDVWLESGQFPDQLLDDVRDDRPFIVELVLGIMRRRRSLEWFLDQLMRDRPRGALGACLMVGVYQLIFMDNVAEYAAVNESVKAARKLCGKRATGLVNGVLRELLRQRDTLCRNFEGQSLAVRESHPDLLVDRWQSTLGIAATEALCHWNNARPRVDICTDADRMTSLLEQFASHGIEAAPHEAAPDRCLELPVGVNIAALPGFTEGWFSVQDPVTLRAVDLLAPQPGDRVLDACAAPGGKTVLIAKAMRGEGHLVAADVNAHRLRRLRDTVGRMRLDVEIHHADACRDDLVETGGGEAFDRILLDVPCTNTGVLRRRPDARWRFSLDKLKALTQLQRSMLDNAAGALRPGGCMVYSTCSLEAEENERMVEAWSITHPDFELADTVISIPPDSATDGAFAARLTRRA